MRRLAGSLPFLSAGAHVRCNEECHPTESYRPSIFQAAREDAACWGNKKIATMHYLKDVDRFQHANCKVIAHRPFTSQATNQSSRTLRVVSWNVNNLCGLAGNSNPWGHPHPPAEFAEAIRSLQPDVIVLQEVVSDSDDYDDPGFEEACSRVQQLEAMLEADGFTICKSSCGNPVLLATRLPITEAESFNLDDDHQWSHLVGTTPGKLKRVNGVKLKVNESRAALYVKLDLGADKQFGIYATHLHHRNYTQTPDGARAAEMRTLLKHQSSRDGVAALVVGDLNQPRSRDYSSEEWQMVAGSSVDGGGCAQRNITEDDGVDDLLQRSGFCASWDLPAARNFPGTGAPPMTHWSGVTVDYIYLQTRMTALSLAGAYVVFSPLSDHLPILADVTVGGISSE